jgi:ubiquinone/menaquinone biosynthesis C-methylase UbiE
VLDVFGIDSSTGALAHARSNPDGRGSTNVELGEADVTALPDDAADAAVANMVLHQATDPVAMLAGMAGVVPSGGTVAITDCIEHEYQWMSTEQADVWLGFGRDSVAEMFAAAGLVEFDHALPGTA